MRAQSDEDIEIFLRATVPGLLRYARTIRSMVADFDRLPMVGLRKPRVGVVGEILVKFHPTANNRIVRYRSLSESDISGFIAAKWSISQGETMQNWTLIMGF